MSGSRFSERDLRKMNVKENEDGSYSVVSKKEKAKAPVKPYPVDGIYIFKINPCAKPRMTQGDQWRIDPNHPDPKKRQRPAVTRYWNFKHELLREADRLGVPELPSRLKSLVFLVPMPKSWSVKKKNAMYGQLALQRPDLDNYLKAIWDCLCEEDSHIACIDGPLAKYWDHEGKIILKI